MSLIWMSHVAHMNESCRTYEWDMSHIWMSHVAHMNESYRDMSQSHAHNDTIHDLAAPRILVGASVKLCKRVSYVWQCVRLYVYMREFVCMFVRIYVRVLVRVHVGWIAKETALKAAYARVNHFPKPFNWNYSRYSARDSVYACKFACFTATVHASASPPRTAAHCTTQRGGAPHCNTLHSTPLCWQHRATSERRRSTCDDCSCVTCTQFWWMS